MRFVLDASIVLTWCFPDEEAQKAEETSERIALGDRPAVPAFWRQGVSLNAPLMRRKAAKRLLTRELTPWSSSQTWNSCQLNRCAAAEHLDAVSLPEARTYSL